MEEYPCECPNHHLKFDNFAGSLEDWIAEKKESFVQSLDKKYGPNPLVQFDDMHSPSKVNAFLVGSIPEIKLEILSRLDYQTRGRCVAVCKEWAREIDYNFNQPLYVWDFVSRIRYANFLYYKSYHLRSEDGVGLKALIRYKRACELRKEAKEAGDPKADELLEPSDDEFEDYDATPGNPRLRWTLEYEF
ncbi:hypothetical protein SOVF_203030 [Spinacia oleracea]|nr:hypothetical protein SOVF_203030 [Spinacia oleracea]